jgi:serine/threonine protein kinase
MSQSIAGPPRPEGDLHVAQAWLDALASGACDEAEFLRAVRDLTRKNPDTGWDLLSLLDQFYRRGKIKPEAFRNLKSHLEGQLLGTSLDTEVSFPLPQSEDSLPAAGHTAAPAATPKKEVVGSERAPSSPPAVGDVLRGRYRIKSVLGRGGTGTVFEALDQSRLDLPTVGQRLAIKVLHSAVAERAELLLELRREFQHLQSLSHPNIIRVHEYDRDGDTPFFTMELLSGLSLSRVLSARHQVALDRPHALYIIRDIAAALEHAHARDIVHGDLNPGNVFITQDGEVRILDFGASHTFLRPRASEFAAAEQKPIATPRYASCQLLEGHPADVRDDVYALACIIYALLAGRHPFGEHTAIQARTQRLTPRRPSGLTFRQWRSLRQGLSFDRARRPAEVEEWLKPFGLRAVTGRLPVLLALLKVSPGKRGRMLLPALGAAAMLLLAAGWWTAGNVESVTRAFAKLSAEGKVFLASAEAASTHLWHRALIAAGISRNASANPSAVPKAAVHDSSGVPPLPPQPASSVPQATYSVRAPAPSPAPSPAPAPAPAPARSAAAHPTAPARTAALSSTAAAAGSARALAGVGSQAPNGAAGHSRIELAADTVDVPPDAPAARVVVRRSGSLHGEASFSWWTESGTAKPGRDFGAVATHEEHIEAGKSTLNLFIPVVGDSTRRQPTSFYVVIGDPSPGASLGARTLTMVTIPASE